MYIYIYIYTHIICHAQFKELAAHHHRLDVPWGF